MKGIGGVIIVGLVIWWLSQRATEAKAATIATGLSSGEIAYDSRHTHEIVPITNYATQELSVYG
uniref:Uncharacterized protein n=1 Tax=viral metagenome TaxID=1070528 RepID=A0A6M3IRE0_9ZZZZ